MYKMDFENILQQQKEFYLTHKTKDVDFRIDQLKKFRKLIQQNQDKLYHAIQQDFGKSKFETFVTEISFVLNDLDYYIKNVKKLAKPRSVSTNMVNLPGSSKIHYEPLGNVLVIGAWNYPYQLSLSPAIAAIAAGNTCIIKPSEVAEHTAEVMATLINNHFDPKLLCVVQGGINETTELLNLKFDKIFFTGSTRVGKIVYEAAAKNLTPVTLELGGKSPAIVTKNTNFETAAKRIVWGKYINAGQTCVAPDYILVDQSVQQKFLEYLRQFIKKFNYSPGSEQYTRIINRKNFDRLQQLIAPENVFYGGDSDAEKLFIEPTVLHNINWDDAVMKEEIFGPILPVLSYQYYREALLDVLNREKPLAAYLFSNSAEEQSLFTEQLSFGGGCINDVLMHLGNPHLPFGGVGNSGIGNYHGKFGFETFSHQKAVMKRAMWGEPDLKYAPYTEKKMNWIKKLM